MAAIIVMVSHRPKNRRSVHSYQVPCVVALPIEAGNEDYLNWLIAETKTTDINIERK